MKRGLRNFGMFVTIILIALIPTQVFAQSQATGVGLSNFSGCTSPAGLDLSMNTDATVNREGGIVTDSSGAILLSFDQSSGFANYSGTFTGYNFASPAWSVPAGEIVGLYAYIGSLPYNAATTVEWFIAYRCDTQEIVASCFGPYGSCPNSADDALLAVGNCPNPLPANYTVQNIPAGALAYFAPDSSTYTGFNLPPGTWYTGAETNGFVPVWIACEAAKIYVPVENVQ